MTGEAARIGVIWAPEGRADLRVIDREIAMQIIRCIDRYLASRVGDVKSLKTPLTGFRMRCGDYRVFFDSKGENANRDNGGASSARSLPLRLPLADGSRCFRYNHRLTFQLPSKHLDPSRPNPLTFQELLLRLQAFWAERGCVLQQPYDAEVGAGTMAPETFLRVLGPKPYKVAYVQPSRRPADGRYGENPNRLFKHMQLQVILKPPPENVQGLYLESLGAIGIDLRQHDIKFEEDNWEAPTLSAWGVGWQVMLDGLEITQFTYFQQCGGVDLFPISAELTYGLERIAAFLQDVDSIYDIAWARDPETGHATTYGDVRLADELQFSVYNFEMADVEKAWKHFELCEAECKGLLEKYAALGKDQGPVAVAPTNGDTRTGPTEFAREKTRFPLLGAYDLCLKCSHLFNILDARGAISVTERVGVIARVRALAVGIAKAWVDQQKSETAAAGDKSDEEEPARLKRPNAKKEKLAPVGS